jgi:hypothetical protein
MHYVISQAYLNVQNHWPVTKEGIKHLLKVVLIHNAYKSILMMFLSFTGMVFAMPRLRLE